MTEVRAALKSAALVSTLNLRQERVERTADGGSARPLEGGPSPA